MVIAKGMTINWVVWRWLSVAGHIGFCFLRTDCLTALYISCRTGVVTCSNLCVNFAVADFAAGDEIIGLGDEGVCLSNSCRRHRTSFFSGVEILEMRLSNWLMRELGKKLAIDLDDATSSLVLCFFLGLRREKVVSFRYKDSIINDGMFSISLVYCLKRKRFFLFAWCPLPWMRLCWIEHPFGWFAPKATKTTTESFTYIVLEEIFWGAGIAPMNVSAGCFHCRWGPDEL